MKAATCTPPILGIQQWAEVMQSCGYRCECIGECGRKRHTRSPGKRGGAQDRCPVVCRPSRPLHVVPADPGVVPLRAASLPIEELLALCPECRRGRDAKWAKEQRATPPADEGEPLW